MGSSNRILEITHSTKEVVVLRVRLNLGSYPVGRYNVNKIGNDMKPPIPLTSQQAQARAAASESNHLAPPPAWDSGLGDWESGLPPAFVPLAKPPVEVHVMDREAASEVLPSFDYLHEVLADTAENLNCIPEHAAIVVGPSDIGENSVYSGSGSVLVANVPTYLAPYLGELAQAQPELINWSTLDLKDTGPLLFWTIRDKRGHRHSIAVTADILTKLLTPDAEHAGLSFARVIFCAADVVAFGGFWTDESDIDEAQAAGVSGMRYWQYSDSERAVASARAQAAGSPTPWYNNPWRDEDDSVVTQLAVWGLIENSPPASGGDDEMDKGYVHQTLPAVDVHIVDRAKASDFLPELEDHQMRLAAACSGSRTNLDAAAFSIEMGEVGENAFHGTGPLLLANLPAYLAPLLSKLADSEPYLFDRPTLGINGGVTLLAWSARDDKGHLHTVAIDAGVLSKMICCAAADLIWYARVAFCCADAVAYCRYRILEQFVWHAERPGVSDLRYYSDDELIAAKLKVAEAGSTTPWYGKPWRDDDENVLTQIIVWSSEDEATSMYEEGPPLLEQYVPPTKPAVEVCLVDRTQASRYIPDYDMHQVRLADACADGRGNPNASAYFTQGRAGNWQEPGVDAALIANIPSYLSHLIEEFARKTPVIVNAPAAETGASTTSLVWRVRDAEGHMHSIAVDVNIVTLLKTRMPKLDELWFVRIAFCCADQVALGGVWIDYADYREAREARQATSARGINSDITTLAQLYPHRLESPKPGYGMPWQNDDSDTLTNLALFISSTPDGPLRKY